MNATESSKSLQGAFMDLPKAGQRIQTGRSKDQNPAPLPRNLLIRGADMLSTPRRVLLLTL